MDGFYPGDMEGDSDSPEATADRSKDEGETFLTPKSAFGEVQPGDKKSFECVHVYEDQIEWKPVGDKSEAKEMSVAEEIEKMSMEGK